MSKKRGAPAHELILPPSWPKDGYYIRIPTDNTSVVGIEHRSNGKKVCFETCSCFPMNDAQLVIDKNFSERRATIGPPTATDNPCVATMFHEAAFQDRTIQGELEQALVPQDSEVPTPATPLTRGRGAEFATLATSAKKANRSEVETPPPPPPAGAALAVS